MPAEHVDPSAGCARTAHAGRWIGGSSSCSSVGHGLSGSGRDSAVSHGAISAVGGWTPLPRTHRCVVR
ncbi:hypothetical protein CAI18_19070 [Xanthomonas citri pv. punicae]|nr:hypothetical protein CAI14_02100 [Xanthomonas citri pv. punicae]QCZ70962.1 hypothetical protein CAI17_22665 [Xanthomonas citri pv. punicae]QCZ78235.1 hypothetical protein XapA_17085 [Xanthomonas citri pv. punicae]QCZ82861.1 hypothetical protein XapB_20525 [Xanthomonas citri pv. punicae]QCZ86788.1 hypothetical protein CAI18_19070 [Xanthomonas citri pv. punicae]